MTDARATQDPALKDSDAAEAPAAEAAPAPAVAPPLRPSILDPLFAPARALPGIGPKMAPLIEKLLGTPEREARVVDLLFHLPQGGVARKLMGSISEAPTGEPVTIGVTVVAHRPAQAGPGRRPHRVLVEDASGDISLVFFGMPRARVEKMLPLGSHRYITGRIDLWDGTRQMIHPSRIVDEAGLAELPAVEPVYGATEGLTSRAINKLAVAALDRLPVLPEWQDPAWLERNRLPAFADALRLEHRPEEAPRRPRTRSSRRPRRRPGSGSPTTSSSPRSWRWRSCAPASGARPAGSMPATAP